MALTASPFGFAARKHPSGQSRANAYTIEATYNTAIGYGDAVILNTNGTITVGTATNVALGTIDSTKVSSVSASILGSDGVRYFPDGTNFVVTMTTTNVVLTLGASAPAALAGGTASVLISYHD